MVSLVCLDRHHSFPFIWIIFLLLPTQQTRLQTSQQVSCLILYPTYIMGTKISVRWALGDDSWKEASQAVKDIGISRFRLYPNPDHSPAYRLDFTATKDATAFIFTDEDGAEHVKAAVHSGDYTCLYDASQPAIDWVEEA